MDKLKLFLISLLLVLIIAGSAYFIGVRKGKLSVKPTITSTSIRRTITIS